MVRMLSFQILFEWSLATISELQDKLEMQSGFILFSTEEPDEDDENSDDDSVEEKSEEDLTETPQTSWTQPPYSLIPPPPAWVQRNQGLSMSEHDVHTYTLIHLSTAVYGSHMCLLPVRSWVELIREKVRLPPAVL